MPTKAKKKLLIVMEFQDCWDAAHILSEKYAEFQAFSEDPAFIELSEDEIYEHIYDAYSGEDLKFLLDTEFGQGLIIGILLRSKMAALFMDEGDNG